MNHKKYNKLFEKEKTELLASGSTQFVYEGLLYYVEEAADAGSYTYDIYSPKGEINNDSPIDGGFFTGSVKDLFEYMTTGNEHLKELF